MIMRCHLKQIINLLSKHSGHGFISSQSIQKWQEAGLRATILSQIEITLHIMSMLRKILLKNTFTLPTNQICSQTIYPERLWHCKRIAPYEKYLLKPQNTVQALYTHRTNTVQALHKHRTVLFGAYVIFSKTLSNAPTSWIFRFSLFFFKNCSSQFRNWYVFTYFSSTCKLYCVVRYTVLLYEYDFYFVDEVLSSHHHIIHFH